MIIVDYFRIATEEAMLSRCVRRRIGVVIVKEGVIIGKGYNMIITPNASCYRGKCNRNIHKVPRGERYDLCNSQHAEKMAILSSDAALVQGSNMYMVGYEVSNNTIIENLDCCEDCKRSVLMAGISHVYILQEAKYLKIETDIWKKEVFNLEL